MKGRSHQGQDHSVSQTFVYVTGWPFAPPLEDVALPGALVRPHSGYMTEFDRISRDVDVMGGEPCLRGTRVTVGVLVGLVATGKSFDEILEAYPYLMLDDIKQALSYAARRPMRPRFPCPHEIPHRHEPQPGVPFIEAAGHQAQHWRDLRGRTTFDFLSRLARIQTSKGEQADLDRIRSG